MERVVYNGHVYLRSAGRRYFRPALPERISCRLDALHRQKWKDRYGAIPAGHDIHHRDGNPSNNRLSNLECLTKREHAAKHAEEHREARRQHAARIRPLTIVWHRSAIGKRWYREHGQRTWQDKQATTILCATCQQPFSTKWPERVMCCSRLCRG